MRHLLLFLSCICLINAFFSCSPKRSGEFARSGEAENQLPKLKPGHGNHYLVKENGDPFFLNAETAWGMAYELDTTQVDFYLNKRKEQKFNALGIVAFDVKALEGPNAYGSEPFNKTNHKYDPLLPTTSQEYDFWDHLDYIINKAEALDFYVILLPTWGTFVAGDWSGKDTSAIVFNEHNAYEYGRWIGDRYSEKKHIIWMIGGDRSAIYGKNDYRSIFRKMAEGITDGVNGENNPDGKADYSQTLMSYHPRKMQPNSSEWFHNDNWLDFNSIQEWPEDQIASVSNDYQLMPSKPTWLFEGRYEEYTEEWKPWQIRYQAYQTVFSGGHGHTYGHEKIWGFFSGWEEQLEDSGAWQMQHLFDLMMSLNKSQYLSRIPDQEIINGKQGTAGKLTSDVILATRGSDDSYSFIYSANGSDIPVKMNNLKGPEINAYWFNPRNGKWHVNGSEYSSPRAFEEAIESGPGASGKIFDPPGLPEDKNDWVLVLR